MVDRIDFTILSKQVIVNKMMQRNGRTVVVCHEIKSDLDLEAALNWCMNNGFTVRRWDGGARAFFGKPWPIRNRSQIRKARERFSGEGKVNMDFAYDG